MKCKLLVIRNVFDLSDTSKLAEFFYKFTYIMLLYIPFCCYLYADRLYYIISTARISNSFFMALKQFTE